MISTITLFILMEVRQAPGIFAPSCLLLPLLCPIDLLVSIDPKAETLRMYPYDSLLSADTFSNHRFNGHNFHI